jgi:hypothetical protein
MDTHHRLPLKLSGLTIIFFFLVAIGCKDKKKLVSIDPEFSKYIEAYTSGVISKKNAIRIQLTSDVSTTHTLNETIKEDLFDFSPSVKGKAYWIDERTIEFKPEKDLVANEFYEISFRLSKVRKVPSKYKTFTFNAQVIKPSYNIEDNGLRAMNGSKDNMTMAGTLLTADVEENAKVEKIITAKYPGNDIKINWQHNEANKTHSFTIDNIKRGSDSKTLNLVSNGDPLNIKQQESKEIMVPAEGSFIVMSIKPVQAEETYTLIQFSDPIAINQDLNGLIVISEQSDISYTIDGSEVKVYAANKLDGNYKVSVNAGILNQWGKKLSHNATGNIFFENRLPSVKIHGRGTILPNSGGKLVLPFEATNLKAVDVSI